MAEDTKAVAAETSDEDLLPLNAPVANAGQASTQVTRGWRGYVIKE